MIIQAGVGVVHVGDLGNVVDTMMCHLEYGNTNGNIVGSPKILSIIIFQVFLFDIPEELGVKCSEVGSHKRELSIAIGLYDMIFEWSRETDIADKGYKIAVDKPTIMCLKLAIKQFKYLPAHEHIVAVDNHVDLVWLAVGQCGFPEIGHGSALLLIMIDIDMQQYASLLVLVQQLLDIGVDEPRGVVSGCVIDDHNMVVGIVLLHD